MLRILFLALLLAVPACKKDEVEQAPPKSKVVETTELGDVVATLQLPSGNGLKELAPLMDKVQPGSSAMMGAQIPMLLGKACGVDLSAADLSKPTALLVLNPKKFKEPFAVLVHVENLKKLEAAAKGGGGALVHRDGLALVGPSAVVESAQGYAFGSLTTPSPQIVGIAYPGPLNTIYKQEVGDAITNMANTMESLGGQGESMLLLMKLYQKALGSLAEQSDRIEVSFDTQSQTPSLLLKMYPIAGSNMAALVEAQIPAEHKLLNRLPPSADADMFFSGVMRAGAARKAIIDFGVEAMMAMYQNEELGKIASEMGPWFDAFDGRVAMSMSVNMDPTQPGGGPAVRYLMGSEDPKAMRAGWHKMFDVMAAASGEASALNMMGMKAKVAIHKNALQVEGVEVDHYHSQFDLTSMPPGQREAMENMGVADQHAYFTAFDDVAALASGKGGKTNIASMIAAARGTGAGFQGPALLAMVLEASRARKESLVMYMNMKGMLPAGAQAPIPFQTLVMGFGKADGALVWRWSVGL